MLRVLGALVLIETYRNVRHVRRVLTEFRILEPDFEFGAGGLGPGSFLQGAGGGGVAGGGGDLEAGLVGWLVGLLAGLGLRCSWVGLSRLEIKKACPTRNSVHGFSDLEPVPLRGPSQPHTAPFCLYEPLPHLACAG